MKEEYIKSVALMNLLAGNKHQFEREEEFYTNCANALERVEEEAREGFDAYQKMGEHNGSLRSLVEELEFRQHLLDSVVDIFVVYARLYQLMENNLSFNLHEAIQRVCENNLTKFPTDRQVAEDTLKTYAEQGIECYIAETEHEGVTYYAIKRVSDNKFLKPIGYESVNLAGCY